MRRPVKALRFPGGLLLSAAILSVSLSGVANAADPAPGDPDPKQPMETVQIGPPSTDGCAGVEQALSKVLDQTKMSHSTGRWMVDPPPRDRETDESIGTLRLQLAKCPPLSASASVRPAKAMLEEILNGGYVRIGTSSNKLKVEPVEAGPKKDQEVLRQPPSLPSNKAQLDEIVTMLNGLAKDIKSLAPHELPAPKESTRESIGLSGLLLIVLSVVAIGTMLFVAWWASSIKREVMEAVKAQKSSYDESAKKIAVIEARHNATPRQPQPDDGRRDPGPASSRNSPTLSPQQPTARDRPLSAAARPANDLPQDRTVQLRSTAAEPAAFPPARPSPTEERDRRYNEVIDIIKKAVLSLPDFELARTRVHIVPLERAGAGGLRETNGDAASSDFWGVQFDEPHQLLLFPGPRYFASAAALAASGGQAAEEAFSGLFSIDWSGRDLTIIRPGVILRDHVGEYRVSDMGQVGLFRR